MVEYSEKVLEMRAAPNKSLQRTRLRAPLSSEPLGVGRVRCAPARGAEPEPCFAGIPQAASDDVSRMTAPALGPVTWQAVEQQNMKAYGRAQRRGFRDARRA